MEVKPLRRDSVQAGYKRSDVGVIPEDWESPSIGEVAEIKVGRDLIEERFSKLRDSSYPFPVYSNTVANEGLYGFYSIPEYEGDSVTVVGRGAGLGTAFARTGGYGAIGRLLVLMPNRCVDAGFLTAYINQRVSIFIETGGIPQLTGIQFSKYKTALPPLPEQRAIATALSDVDGLLVGLDRLIAKKRDLKQAAMQQLLPGQTRLPGFHGEWEVKRLGDVIHLIRGGIYGEEKPRPGLRACSVATTAHIEMDDTWNNKEMPVRYFTAEKLRDYATVEGDLIVVKSSGSAASIQSGKLGFIDTERAGKFVFSNFLMLLRPTAVLPRFLYFYLCSHNVKKLLPTLVEASTYPNIRLGDYLAVEIPVPSPDEQTAIAKVLTDMDAELAALEQRQEKTRALKQAMMQELLSGRTRLVGAVFA